MTKKTTSSKKECLFHTFFNKLLCPPKDKRKLKKLVQSRGFNMFIMGVILGDAITLGLLSSPLFAEQWGQELFILDRLFMSIFIVEMFMKIYALGNKFFKCGWNIFDFLIVAVSSVPFASAFIVLRTFRLFRMFRFIHRWKLFGDIVDAFMILIPAMFGLAIMTIIFFYAFAIIGIDLYGDMFSEYATLHASMIATLETFAIDGWLSHTAQNVMTIYPHAWIFYGLQCIIALMLAVSFIATAVAETIRILQQKNI